MTITEVRGEGEQALREPCCPQCGNPLQPQTYNGPPRKFCSRKCRDRANYERRRDAPSSVRGEGEQALREQRKRRPLPDAANDAAWKLRRDVERLERIFADDRFGENKEKVTPLLRSHLAHAAQACQDLLSRLNHPIGE